MIKRAEDEYSSDVDAVLREIATTVIVTPNCPLMRGSENERFACKEKHPEMIVVSAAAPDLNPKHKEDPSGKHSPAGDQKGLAHRLNSLDIRHEALANALQVAANEGADTIVIGAWGAGAFQNKTEDIAEAWAVALKKHGGRFRQ